MMEILEYLMIRMRKWLMLVLKLAVMVSFISIASGWGEFGAEKVVADLRWRGLFTSVIHQLIFPGLAEIYKTIPDVILSNPRIEHYLIWKPLTYFIKTLEPVYVLLIIITGFYLILMSGSIGGRRKAKSLLPRLIAGVVLVTLSPYILKIFLNMSKSITSDVLNLNPNNKNIFLETFNFISAMFANSAIISMEGSQFFLFLAIIVGFVILLFLALRYILLTLLIILSPIAIFLYFFTPTKNVGRVMLEQTTIWIFTQVFCALIFVSSNIGMLLLNLHGNLRIIAGLTASLILIVSPLIPFLIIRRFLP